MVRLLLVQMGRSNSSIPSMATPILNILDKGWPFAASVLAGTFAFGSLHSDVADLKTQQLNTRLDHDAIVRIEQAQADMKTDLEEIKHALKK